MKNKIFAYFILGLNAVAAWISWWVLGASIFDRFERHDWLLPILSFSVWALMFSLVVIFVRKKLFLYGSFALALSGYFIFVDLGLSAVALALMLAFLILTERAVKKELVRSVDINFYRVVNTSLKYFVTAVCVVAAVAYYFSLESGNGINMPNIERKTLEEEVKWGLKVAGFVMPEKEELIRNIEEGITLDEYLLKSQPSNEAISEIADTQLKGVIEQQTVPVQEIKNHINRRIQDEVLAQSKKQISEQLGVAVVGHERVKDVLTGFIEKKQNDFLVDAFSKAFYLSLVMALGLFLAIRLIGAGADILLGFLILGLIKLLVASGAVSLKRETRQAAVIEYSI